MAKTTISRDLSLEATQRDTAKALGVSEATINRDVNPVTNVTTTEQGRPTVIDTDDPVTNVTTLPSDERPNPLGTSGDDASKIVEKQITKAHDKAQQYGHDQGDEWYTPKWLFDSLGLQFSMDVCAPDGNGTAYALRKLRKDAPEIPALQGHGGAREKQGDNIPLRKDRGTSPTYAIARLRRDAPEIHGEVLAGNFSTKRRCTTETTLSTALLP